ncbi:aldehyde dehydrogenase [Aliiglaciecola sp. CAU 1673]|uniref:aldehyde dehydrogenase n=1 Tax=Aliiglaciecola sp. CAU 1673 TaxID=3032595 RepID=UPI0023DA7871|nr:aldehyde dehydrogenase [Aliiglaciecola sp. CAU 1673]MDF2176817.1 aldehyde dehydrogenase [Aliiglaciecola sp. CAU 1673]
MQILANFINGEFLAPKGGRYLDNIEPASGKVYGQIPDSDEADLTLAIDAADKAFPAWSAMPLEQRADILTRISQRILERLEELAAAESKDNGKPLSLAKMVDIPRAASNFAFFAHACSQFSSEAHAMAGSAINYSLRQPLGIVGCISPWNLPLYLFTWKIAPALAAGNCVIAKPSEITPLTAYLLGEICNDAGLPPGVLSILHGRGADIGAALVSHPKIKGLSFTGGTATGKAIAQATAGQLKKVSLELGGKNPALVFADCDVDKTVDALVRASFANQGQICLCPSRLYIERPIYDRFKAAFVEKAVSLIPGDPAQVECKFGALVSQAHLNKVLGYIQLAKDEGGTLLCGGEQVQVPGRCAEGYFVKPTVFEGLDNSCRTNQEEIFGPVVTLQPFDTEEEALVMANDSQYGLASTLWTSDLARAHRLGEKLETGIVWVNCWLLRDLRTPFGGMKGSGLGREGGLEAMRFFTEVKNVCISFI